MAIHLMTSSKKGISSHQMARELGITQKSAWFLNHRIREAMKQEPMAGCSGNGRSWMKPMLEASHVIRRILAQRRKRA